MARFEEQRDQPPADVACGAGYQYRSIVHDASFRKKVPEGGFKKRRRWAHRLSPKSSRREAFAANALEGPGDAVR